MRKLSEAIAGPKLATKILSFCNVFLHHGETGSPRDRVCDRSLVIVNQTDRHSTEQIVSIAIVSAMLRSRLTSRLGFEVTP